MRIRTLERSEMRIIRIYLTNGRLCGIITTKTIPMLRFGDNMAEEVEKRGRGRPKGSKTKKKTQPTTTTRKTNKNLWKPGESGNPNGRPKGAKNRVTLIKEALEAEMVEKGSAHALQVLETVVDMAVNERNEAMLKELMARYWPIHKGDKGAIAGKGDIIINVTPLETKEEPSRAPIDVEVVER